MSLSQYKKKRSFQDTPEPTGGSPAAQKLHFVVQKHDASRLHYDFRLELKGVLKSWAIPKGPSLNPADKRLAMMVEDHPYDYKDFEGIIPKGNYGAGTVIVWDEGSYEPLEKTGSKEEAERKLAKELKAGSLKFRLNGKKLKGEFALVHIKGKEDNAWLLIKHRDSFAAEEPVTEKDKSVLSGKTIEQTAANKRAKEWISNRTDDKPGKKEKPKTGRGASSKKKMPAELSPMLATLVDKPFDEPGWIYEVKWDGYRAICFLDEGKVEIYSRNNKSFNEKFYPIYEELKKWKTEAIVDGEIMVLNDKGISNFGSLQNWRSEADGNLIYYLFDLLWLNGENLMELPLIERRRRLREIVPASDSIKMSENFDASATEFFEAAQKMGLEGIIAKKEDSVYIPGTRTRDWLKIKTQRRQEVVIGGFTRNEGTAKTFSALLAGVYEDGKLNYIGKIGTGFNTKQQGEMMKQFKPRIIRKPPFQSEPDVNKPSRFRPNPPHAKVYWLKPELVCEVSFTEITSDGVMRHPSFQGMREDKNAKAVTLEKALPVGKPGAGQKKLAIEKIIVPMDTAKRKSFLNPKDKMQVREINGHTLKFTNLDKIYWPKDNISKRDMLNYYYQVAPCILPYLRDRPQSLNRHPNGINGPSFYQKDVTGKVPDWIETFLYHSEGDLEDKHFLVCTDEASLLYMASLGCIELNPWSSRVSKPDCPDWCIIDLDPDKKNTYEEVIRAAHTTHALLEKIGVPSVPKTSGSTGMHIYIPLAAKYTYEQSKEFARAVVTRVQQQIPDFTSIERTVSKRKGKMYLDFLQNRPQATIAAPYSLRPKPGATVSVPLDWSEVKKGLTIQQFTIKNVPARLDKVGDLFSPVTGKGINLQKALKQLEDMD
jgi:bifunctional non-homologous end joining protein LigD